MEQLLWAFDNLSLSAIIDILLVALIFYTISFFIRGTQALALARGMVLFVGGVIVLSSVLNLLALRWLLENLLTVFLVAIPVIFQPELRRALERLGRAGILWRGQPALAERERIIHEVVQAAEKLSERRHGALIVLTRSSSLEEYVRTGVPLNSEVTAQLLLTIFWPKTELHDGAVIINREGLIASAASVLPLSSSRTLTTPKLGTRHRAALGLSEVSDAIVVVVSEETGRITIANGGRLISRLDPKRLQTILNAIYGAEHETQMSLMQRVWAQLLALVGRSVPPGAEGAREGQQKT